MVALRLRRAGGAACICTCAGCLYSAPSLSLLTLEPLVEASEFEEPDEVELDCFRVLRIFHCGSSFCESAGLARTEGTFTTPWARGDLLELAWSSSSSVMETGESIVR